MKLKPLSKKIKEKLQESMSEDIGEKSKSILEDLLNVGEEMLTSSQKQTLQSKIVQEKYIPKTDDIKVESDWKNGKWFTAEYRKFRAKQMARVHIKSFIEKILEEVRLEIDDEVFDSMLDTRDERKSVAIITVNQLKKMGGITW